MTTDASLRMADLLARRTADALRKPAPETTDDNCPCCGERREPETECQRCEGDA